MVKLSICKNDNMVILSHAKITRPILGAIFGTSFSIAKNYVKYSTALET